MKLPLLFTPAVAALAVAAFVAVALPAAAQTPQRPPAFELVTPAEARADAAAPAELPRPRMRSLPRPGASQIRVVSPDPAAAAPVPAPLRIELAFSPAPGARIVPATFRILYGVLKIDLTERLRRHATISEAGVVVDGAQVPDGQHRLLLQVADDQGHVAEQELRIRVGAAS